MTSAPTKAERELCWSARDEYWQCLDKNKDDASKCKEHRQRFESDCTKTWLKYFDRRRDYLKYKDKIEKEGFEPISDKSKT